MRRQNFVRAFALVTVSLGLVQCDRIRETIDQYSGNQTPAPAATETRTPPGPPASDYAFDIDLRFDDASKKALSDKNIQIKMTTAYYGTPNKQARADADESGILNLGHDTIMVSPSDQIVKVVPNGLKTGNIRNLIDQKPSVIIRTYTSQRLEDGRMIDCTIYDNRFEVAKEAPARVNCRMFRVGRVQFVPGDDSSAKSASDSGDE